MRRAHTRSVPASPPRRSAKFWTFHVPKWGLGLLLLGAAALTAVALAPGRSRLEPVSGVLKPQAAHVSGHTVVIDAGHGGADPGAVGRNGLKEKDVTLPIAQQVERLLNRAAVYTVMVRRGDYDLADPGLSGFSNRKRQDIERRVGLANAKDADVYLSIHANSFPGGPWKGAQTFYAAGDGPGKDLARAVQTSLVRQLGPNNRREKVGDFAVLNKTQMPAVIVEVGFLSHPEEARRLSDPQYQREVAEAIYEGLVEHWVAAAAPRPEASETPPAEETTRPVYAEMPGRAWLFAVGTGDDGSPALVPVDRPLIGVGRDAGAAVVATAAVEALIHFDGSTDGRELAGPLPAGTRLLGMRLEDGTAFVDFSRELTEGERGGATSEALAVYAVVNTLTAVHGIERVVLTVEGERTNTVGGHLFVDQPMEWNGSWLAQDGPDT